MFALLRFASDLFCFALLLICFASLLSALLSGVSARLWALGCSRRLLPNDLSSRFAWMRGSCFAFALLCVFALLRFASDLLCFAFVRFDLWGPGSALGSGLWAC